MATYILRKIDPNLWLRVRAKAKIEHISIKDLIERFLCSWLGGF